MYIIYFHHIVGLGILPVNETFLKKKETTASVSDIRDAFVKLTYS